MLQQLRKDHLKIVLSWVKVTFLPSIVGMNALDVMADCLVLRLRPQGGKKTPESVFGGWGSRPYRKQEEPERAVVRPTGSLG